MHASSQSTFGTPNLPPAVIMPPVARPRTPSLRDRWRRDKPHVTKPVAPTIHDAAPTDEDLEQLEGRFHYRTLKRQLEEMPAWLFSLFVHLLLLLLLALISTSSGQIGDMVLTITQGESAETPEFAEFSIEPIQWEDLPTETPNESELDIDPLDFDASVELVSLEPVLERGEGLVEASVVKLPPSPKNMFGGRSGAMKQELLKRSGGTQATEDAVKLGLQWLKRQQLGDGSWSLLGPYSDGARSENKVSATAMAMIAFMGSGSTHHSGPYRKELARAVRWLVKQQDRQGFMAVQSAPHEKMYAQAQAMIALCELYAMTGDSWIRPYAQRSCDFAVRAQSPQGGWRYQPRIDSDTSVTGWFVMGLKSGEAGGLEVDDSIWPNVQRYLDSVRAGRENDYYAVGYAYTVGDVASPSMTAEGLLCRQYLGWHRNMPGMAQGLGTLAINHPISFRQPDVYYWYYATQALHHYGGRHWTEWNDKLKVDLPARQVLHGRERGSWSPQNDAWGRHAGRLYTTCFSVYCLEVYYRHMPLYDPENDFEE
ncbi:prenyltransferase/squalene oxidase repeat-containing protein [Stieleria magnilauensis]|uniref:Squalene cyclase C-terminal domain-containing protein n=1 Tax=Stieleria magnilauensis TaxID=2527963 RepID=A0ABX5XK28_9BACT|nr:hypothetical protein TBK1r_09770 [Planctomycetes bacterium TBK1r]